MPRPRTGSESDQDATQSERKTLLETNKRDDPPVEVGYELPAYRTAPPPSGPQPPDDENSNGKTAEATVHETWQAQNFASLSFLAQWFPGLEDTEASSWRIWASLRSRALMLQIALIATILVANLVLTVFAFVNYGVDDGAGLIYKGGCDTVKSMDRWLHLLINVLSTGMLGASNFCMQLQTAPTRENVDKAHKDGKWLDIGIPTLRNLRYLDKANIVVWALLALSSLPIHLLYNSAVFVSIASSNYGVAVVKDSFLNGSSWNMTAATTRAENDPGWNDGRVNPSYINKTDVVSKIQAQASSYQHRDVDSCFQLYQDYWTPQGNVIVQVKNQSVQTPSDDSLLLYVYIVPRSDDWSKNMWAAENGTVRFVAQQSDLTSVSEWYLGPPRYEASSCLVQDLSTINLDCRLEYSPHVMVAVCIMNAVKLAVMLWTWSTRKAKFRRQGKRYKQAERDQDSAQALYTLGDAIASFMRSPDLETENMCLATRHDFESVRRPWYSWKKVTPPKNEAPRKLDMTPARWYQVANAGSWITLIVVNLTVIIIGGIILAAAFHTLRFRKFNIGRKGLTSLGFGDLTPFTFLVINLPRQGTSALLLNVLIANLPQLIISLLYMLYNSMISTFMVQREFSQMYDRKHRKPLRVSQPTGMQRSTYFISLPLRYGLPLYAAVSLAHFLLSQSLFLARITAVFPNNTVDKRASFSTCGYSPIPIMLVMVLGLILVIGILLLGMRKFDGTMRMVSTNSLAISAACHCPEQDRKEGYLMPIQWGVISKTSEGVLKCAVTTAADPEVDRIVEGALYR